ncbi:toxin-antitoxin system toxin subunit [Spongiactinospora rosea]|uniref:Toxin-antitoxin system toxin subunit n=2 Tax=Spongiactinospora rosea TaxID=2248750 RepID=A0A366LYR5_9ACTN|nr:toxin-antitoxin system toxin subunit [Spongiactinospora rosea]
MERRLAHPPHTVWQALTDPARLAHWFPMQVEWELRIGGKVTFTGAGTGVITELDPPRVIAYTWEGENLRWEVIPDGGHSLLVLTHIFDDHYGAASYAAGWQACVSGMDELLRGAPITPAGRMLDAHETLVARLGLQDGVAADSPAGWRVRFERQLTLPVGQVWAMLLGGDAPPVPGDAPPAAFITAAVPAAEVTKVWDDTDGTDDKGGAAPRAGLEYAWRYDERPAGRVRFELAPGTGHGARLVLTQDGPADLPDARQAALAAWRDHIAALAARVRRAAG